MEKVGNSSADTSVSLAWGKPLAKVESEEIDMVVVSLMFLDGMTVCCLCAVDTSTKNEDC